MKKKIIITILVIMCLANAFIGNVIAIVPGIVDTEIQEPVVAGNVKIYGQSEEEYMRGVAINIIKNIAGKVILILNIWIIICGFINRSKYKKLDKNDEINRRKMFWRSFWEIFIGFSILVILGIILLIPVM